MSEHTPSSTRQSSPSDATHIHVAGLTVPGLIVGLTLHANGHDVTIAPTEAANEQRVSSIPLGPAVTDILTQYTDTRLDDCATPAGTYRYLAPDGTTEAAFGTDLQFTASDTLTTVLRDHLPANAMAPDQQIYPGTAPIDTPSSVEHEISGSASDTRTPTNTAARASNVTHVERTTGRTGPDLFVAADGWLSPTRQRVLPEVTPEYAGYVAWHGTVDAATVPTDLTDRFADAVTVSRTEHDLLVVTVVPGPSGGTTPEDCRLQWVWYSGVPARELGSVLTDHEGINHDRAVAPGDVRQEYVDGLRDRSAAHAPALTRLVRATPDPGVEPVVDVTVPDAVVGRAAFVGDAAFTSRDHAGSSTEKAAEDARSLATALDRYEDIDGALGDWAATQELRGRQLVEAGRQTDLDGLVERA